MKHFLLAMRLLWRDGRSGELTILLSALVIAVSCSTTISLFSDRLQRTMQTQAAEFLAADLAISSPTPLAATILNEATHLGLTQAQTTEFSSVLMENDEILLASVKAATALYPLRGYLKISDSDVNNERISYQPPPAGDVWVEKRILNTLKLKLGDHLTIGEKTLIIRHILSYEPDKQGNFYAMSPRVLMNATDLAATKVLQPGSRIHYHYLFKGETVALEKLTAKLKPLLTPSQHILDIHHDRPEIGNALTRAEHYLGISSVVVILIAGIAIALATRRYSERHFNNVSILRCLGCKQREILGLFSAQFLILGLIGSTIGSALGGLTHFGLFYLLRDLLPIKIVAPGWSVIFLGFLIGFAILLGFALPPLLRLKNVPALRVLRRELEPLPSSAWLIYGLALSLVFVLIQNYVQQLKMTFTLIGGSLLLLSLTGGLIYLSLKILRSYLNRFPLSWRLSLRALTGNPNASISQILAFSMTLVAMILSFTLRTDLLKDWQQQLPVNAPNYFALNIFPSQLKSFATDLQQQQIHSNVLYPMVMGRLVAINGVQVQKKAKKDSQGERAIQRDLNLTWSANLPADNQVIAGNWWNPANATKNLVSVEDKLAESLQIKLADQLTFTIGNQQVIATVSNLRRVNWDTLKPNFYMVFSPATLDHFPSTYLTSFYLAATEKQKLNGLLKTYPNMTVLEVDLILAQLNKILAQLTQAINYVLCFALFAGFTVLLANVYTTLDQRIYQGALMRTLGAHRKLLHKIHLLEFALLGFISGILAVIMSQILVFALYHWVLYLDYIPNWRVCLATPFIGMGFVTLTGYFGVRGVVKQSPMLILRQQ